MRRPLSLLRLLQAALLGLCVLAVSPSQALGAEPTAATTPPRVLGLSHVAVKATDYEASVAFYRDFLGLAEQGRLVYPNNGRRELVFLKVNDTQTIEVFDAANVTQVAGNLYQIAVQVEDAEAMRLHLLRHGFKMPPRVPLGQMRNANFTLRDPNGYIIEIVQYLPEGRMVLDRGKFLSATRVSDRLVAAGVTTTRLPETLRFYSDVFGFPPVAPLPAPEANDRQVRLQVADSDDTLEVNVAPPDPTPYFRFAVRDLNRAKTQLERSAYFPIYGRPVVVESEPSHRRIIRLRDPEGIRVELVEPAVARAKTTAPHAPPARTP